MLVDYRSGVTSPIIDPITAFYAAVTAVENGQVAEVEVEYRLSDGEIDTALTMTVRQQVKHFSMDGELGE